MLSPFSRGRTNRLESSKPQAGREVATGISPGQHETGRSKREGGGEREAGRFTGALAPPVLSACQALCELCEKRAPWASAGGASQTHKHSPSRAEQGFSSVTWSHLLLEAPLLQTAPPRATHLPS